MIDDATHEGAEELLDKKIDEILEPATDAQDEDEENKDAQDVEEESGEEEEPDPEKKEGDAEETTLTLTQIADIFGLDENLLELNEEGKVVFKTKIDGMEGKVSPAEALKSYQLEGHLNKQNMEVVNQRKALEAERSRFQEEQTHKIQQLEDTLALAVNQLNHDFRSIDWERLKVSDPNEYLMRRQEFQERQIHLQNSYQTLQQARQENMQRTAQEYQGKLREEYQKMRTSIPGWDDDAKFEQGKKEIKESLMKDYGFSDEEISHAIDHRLIKMARDAAEFQKLQKAKSAVVKKIKAAPKVVKSGQQVDDKTDLKKALDAVKKSKGEKGLDDYLDAKGII